MSAAIRSQVTGGRNRRIGCGGCPADGFTGTITLDERGVGSKEIGGMTVRQKAKLAQASDALKSLSSVSTLPIVWLGVRR